RADVRPRLLRQSPPARPPARRRARPPGGAAGLARARALALARGGRLPLRAGVPRRGASRARMAAATNDLLCLGGRDLRLVQPRLLLRDRRPRPRRGPGVAPALALARPVPR